MKVLFVDDDWRRLEHHVDELKERGFEVIFTNDVDDAVEKLRDLSNHYDLAIIDISMPPGKSLVFEDTIGGSRTGKALYELIRRLRPKLKIIALTNVPDISVASFFRSQDRSLCRFVRKPEALPFRFAEIVREFMDDRPTVEEPDNE